MEVRVVTRPADLSPDDIVGRAVVVFDVLRATTTMTAALFADIGEIRVFDTIDLVRTAAEGFTGPKLLCGEEKCLPPAGFDLGNSPGDYTRDRCRGRTAFLSTTNGTRAVVAAAKAEALFAGALVNASAVAKALAETRLPVTLLCSGTEGKLSIEDLLGAGAVMHALDAIESTDYVGDTALVAWRLFESERLDLPAVLARSQGGRNIHAAGLDPDIAFAARLDVFDVVGEIQRPGLIVRPRRGK